MALPVLFSVVSQQSSTRSLQSIVFSNVLTPFNALNAVLLAALAGVYLWRQDVRFLLDAVGVVLSVVSNNVLAIAQELRAHRAVEHAAQALRHTVTVRRNGSRITLDSDDVCVDDVVQLTPGDIMAGDGVVDMASGLEVDASMITGEAVAHACDVGDMVMSGSVCVAGNGDIRVTRVGAHTAAAQITSSAGRLSLATSPMQRSINRLFEGSFVLAIVIAVSDLFLRLQQHELDVDAIRQTAAIVLGLVPEGLVFFSTVAFALCVARVARNGVFVQHLSAIEHLASVNSICFDKTGTLTERRTSVAAIVPIGDSTHHQLASLLRAFAVALGDAHPLIQSLRALPAAESAEWTVTDRVSFTSDRRYSAVCADNGWHVLGAGDVLAPHIPIPSDHTNGRVVVFGKASSITDVQASFRPLCWVVLDDTVCADAAKVLSALHVSEVDVHVLTGDAASSAIRVLERIGRVDSNGSLLAGTHLRARMLPTDKEAYVKALQAAGQQVAFVGDGINDVPAIRAADVGIAAPDASVVTRHVADIVISSAAIGILPSLIQEGRVTMRTIMHVAKIFLAKNAALLVTAALAAISWIPSMLTPRRGGLIAILAVAIPSTILAARSRSDTTVRSTYAEIGRYCGITSLAAALSMIAVGLVVTSTSDPAGLCYVTLLGSILTSLPFVDTHAVTRRLIAHIALIAALLFLGLIIAPSVHIVTWVRAFFEMQGLQTLALTSVASAMMLAVIVTTALHLAVSWLGMRRA